MAIGKCFEFRSLINTRRGQTGMSVLRLRRSIQNVDLAEPRDRTTVTDCVRLTRFALAVVEAAAEFVCCHPAQRIAGIPEVGSPGLVCDVPYHSTDLTILNLPEGLAAKLEVVALLID